MMTPTKRTLTEGELEIMQVVWKLGRCTVRQVYDVLREQKQVAYTTVMTMMGILETKGHLIRNREGRAHVYWPSHSRSRVISSLVDDFLSRVFEGSAKPLVLGLLRERKLSERDLKEIAKLIEKKP